MTHVARGRENEGRSLHSLSIWVMAAATLASLGMDLGSYTWSWGSGGTADSLTLNVVPEPSTAALMVLGIVGLAARRRRA